MHQPIEPVWAPDAPVGSDQVHGVRGRTIALQPGGYGEILPAVFQLHCGIDPAPAGRADVFEGRDVALITSNHVQRGEQGRLSAVVGADDEHQPVLR